jgi:hypothetical protein
MLQVLMPRPSDVLQSNWCTYTTSLCMFTPIIITATAAQRMRAAAIRTMPRTRLKSHVFSTKKMFFSAKKMFFKKGLMARVLQLNPARCVQASLPRFSELPATRRS